MTAALPPALAGLDVETQPQKVRRRSRDFYWYSPVLKRRLDHVTADMVITARTRPRSRKFSPTPMPPIRR
jgi:hypothetical protein